MTPPVPAVETRPLSASLERLLATQAATIPAGRRGHTTVVVTTSGVELGLGTRWRAVTVTGYAGRLWGAPGWTAGARAEVVW
jgi:hypothetical protein